MSVKKAMVIGAGQMGGGIAQIMDKNSVTSIRMTFFNPGG